MEKFVTQEECAERCKSLQEEKEKQSLEISKLYSQVAGLSANIQNLIYQNKWFMGIISSALGGLLIWLITGK